MLPRPLDVVVHHVRTLAGSPPGSEPTDSQLLARFVARHDEDAFSALLRRHGPMVLGVCRRALRHPQDAEDAFQAAFLTLACQACSIRQGESVGGWLYRVAHRIARKASTQRTRNARHLDRDIPQPGAALEDAVVSRELARIIDEELQRLPEKYRAAVLLCDVEGRSHAAAARELGCTKGALSGRLARAHHLLRRRLTRRGLMPAGVLVGAGIVPPLATAAVPAALAQTTWRAASLLATGQSAAGAIAAEVESLLRAATPVLGAGKLKVVTALALVLTTIAAGAGVALHHPPAAKSPEPKRVTSNAVPPRSADPKTERVDAFGDPLPPEALRRIGSIHFRQGGTISSLIPCPDGKTLLSASYYGDRKVCLWELATGRLLRRFPGNYDLRSIALSPDGKVLATIEDASIRLWEVASGRELRQLKGHRGEVYGVTFSPDGKTLASCDGHQDIRLWEAATGTEIARLPWRRSSTSSALLAFTADGKTLITGQRFDTKIHVWDVASRRKRLELIREGGMHIWSLAVSADGTRLATGGCDSQKGVGDGLLPIWDLTTGKQVHRLHGKQKAILEVAFSPDGKLLASSGGDAENKGSVCLWDPATGKPRHCFPGISGALAFSRDGKTLIVGDTIIHRWDVTTGEEIQPPDGPQYQIASLALSPDGRLLASASQDVRLWDARTGEPIRRFGHPGEALEGFAFSPDSKALATVTSEGILRLWDVNSGKEIRVIPVPIAGQPLYPGQKRELLNAVAFSPEARTLATASSAGTLRFWDARTGAELRRISRPQALDEALAFSAGGQRLFAAARTENGTAFSVWGVAKGDALPSLTADINARMSKLPDTGRLNISNQARLALSPDGRMLALNRHTAIPIWESATGKERLCLKGHDGPTIGIAFAPDGRLLASAGWDSTLRLWDLATGTELARLSGHRGNVNALAFSPDGQRLYSGGSDTSILVWDVKRILPRGLPPVPRPAPTAWDDLAGDAAKTYRAMHTLRADPSHALPLFRKHLRPAAPVEEKRLAELIRDLDANEFSTRNGAFQELERLGEVAESALRRALQGTPPLEVRRRIEELLGKLICPTGEIVRQMRAVEVLEHIGNDEARQLLRKFGDGAPAARLTREAAAALHRVGT